MDQAQKEELNEQIHQQSQTNKRSRLGMKLSVASRHPEGLSEQAIKAKAQMESFPSRHYKARKRRELTISEKDQIVESCTKGTMLYKDIAKENRVKVQLVKDLV